LGAKDDRSISHRHVFDTTLDIATPKGSANSPKRCAQKSMNSFTATWNHRVLGKCEHEKFAASCGQIRVMLLFALLAASELRPFFQHCNIDELVQHFARCTPHRFVV
jgi:hypothetical protein